MRKKVFIITIPIIALISIFSISYNFKFLNEINFEKNSYSELQSDLYEALSAIDISQNTPSIPNIIINIDPKDSANFLPSKYSKDFLVTCNGLNYKKAPVKIISDMLRVFFVENIEFETYFSPTYIEMSNAEYGKFSSRYANKKERVDYFKKYNPIFWQGLNLDWKFLERSIKNTGVDSLSIFDIKPIYKVNNYSFLSKFGFKSKYNQKIILEYDFDRTKEININDSVISGYRVFKFHFEPATWKSGTYNIVFKSRTNKILGLQEIHPISQNYFSLNNFKLSKTLLNRNLNILYDKYKNLGIPNFQVDWKKNIVPQAIDYNNLNNITSKLDEKSRREIELYLKFCNLYFYEHNYRDKHNYFNGVILTIRITNNS